MTDRNLSLKMVDCKSADVRKITLVTLYDLFLPPLSWNIHFFCFFFFDVSKKVST